MPEYRVMRRSVPHDGAFDIFEFIVQVKDHPTFDWYTHKDSSPTLEGAVNIVLRLKTPLVQVYP